MITPVCTWSSCWRPDETDNILYLFFKNILTLRTKRIDDVFEEWLWFVVGCVTKWIFNSLVVYVSFIQMPFYESNFENIAFPLKTVTNLRKGVSAFIVLHWQARGSMGMQGVHSHQSGFSTKKKKKKGKRERFLLFIWWQKNSQKNVFPTCISCPLKVKVFL